MIAPRRAEKRRLELSMRRMVAVILIELAFAVALGGWVCMKIITTSVQISDRKQQIALLQPKIKKIQDLDKRTAELKPKVDLLNKAKTDTMLWYNTLDRLTQSMPPTTWLTRISTTTSQSKDMIVNLNGIASDQGRVGETMMRLHGDPDLKSVDLHYTQKSSQGIMQAIEFEIGASFSTPDDKSKGVTQNGSGQS